MTTFAEDQEYRDLLARIDGRNGGDERRRWSTCGRCGHESPEMRLLTEQDGFEDDHMMFGCPAPKPPEREFDDVLERWPDPPPWTWTRRYAPLPAEEEIAGRTWDPIPFRSPDPRRRHHETERGAA